MLQKEMAKPLPEKINVQAGSAPENPAVEIVVPLVTVEQKLAKPSQNNLWDDLTRFNKDDLMKGFVYSLILDKPRCKQRGRR